MSAWLAEDIMNPDVLTVERGTPVADLALFFAQHEISGAPVVDRAGRLAGVVSITDVSSVNGAGHRESARDFYRRPVESHPHPDALRGLERITDRMTVEDIMTPAVISVARDTPVSQIARIMLKDHIHRVIVLEGEKIAGIVTSFDMLRLFVDDESEEVIGRAPRRRRP